MKVINVAHVLYSNSFSGAENVAIKIIKNLNKTQFIRCSYISPKGEIEKKLKEENVPYILLDKFSYQTIKKVDLDFKFDIYHCHDFRTSILVALALKNKKIISHLHQNPGWIKSFNLYSFAYFLSIKRINKVLSVSESIFKEYIFSRFIKNKEVIYNPIDLKDDLTKINNLNIEYDIIYLGRLSEEKNPVDFIKIVKELKEKIPFIRSVMVGGGPLENECKELIIKYGCENNIELVGYKENRLDYLSVSKVVCMPSKVEGFGLVAIEGMALGKPIVSSNIGGLQEIITSRCGLKCTEINQYVNEIYKLLTDDDYYTNKSNYAKERVQDLDNSHYYYKKIENIYKSLMRR